MKWIEIRVEVPKFLEEAVSNRLFELGAQGIGETEHPKGAVLHAYFEKAQESQVSEQMKNYIASLVELFPDLPPCNWKSLPVTDEDWTQRFKEFFKAQKISKVFFLKPAWDEKTEVPKKMIPIHMDLGQAFGTGLHPTTRLCIKLIEKTVSYYPDLASVSFMDVGTGTGILSIAAKKLGFEDITAIDIDPVALKEAKKNLKLNHCSGIVTSTQPLAQYRKPFGILVSNILLETHLELAKVYRDLLVPGGQLVLSGLLTHQKTEVDQKLLSLGFKIEQSEFLQEWAAVLYSLPSKTT